MRIVINALSARLGGGRTYVTNLLANLPEDPALEIHLFAPQELPIADDPRIRRVATRWPTTNPLLRSLWERLSLPAYLRDVDANILFCPGGVVATRAPLGCKVATMFRNMLPFDLESRQRLPLGLQRARNWILSRVLLESMRSAELTIFISDHARRLIEGKARISRSVTIPHGIASHFRTFDRDLPRPPALGDGDYLLYVSRFDAYKNHYEVVQAFASLPEQVRGDLKLIFAGETDSREATRVNALIHALGLGDRILCLGPVPYGSLPAYYRNARAVIFASSCENCPNILLEALGAGRPLLSSDVMPMPEFGGEDIAYFSPFDPADLSAKLEKVLTDPEHAEKLAVASAQRSLRYDWKQTAQSTWAAIDDLARTPASTH